jgi:AP-3 complex subunit beta
MASLSLNTFTENASRLGMRIQETFSERTRDLSIAKGSGSVYMMDASEETVKNLRKQLDSSSDREKLDAMKRIVAVCHFKQLSANACLLLLCSAHIQRP